MSTPDGQPKYYDASQMGGFQPVPGYRDFLRQPQVVITQTDSLLQLYQTGNIRDTDPARTYLHDYTLAFLQDAQKGADRVYTKMKPDIRPEFIELNEAADYANVVFSWMHDRAHSRFLPMGFSRKGMLEAPIDKQVFIKRLDEMKIELGLVVSGLQRSHRFLEAYPSSLRMRKFFEVGSSLPLHFPDDGRINQEMVEETRRKEIEQARKGFDQLMGDVKIDL